MTDCPPVPWPVLPAADVVPFPRPVRHPRTPCPEVVGMCRALLKYAEAGDLQALGVAVVYADDLVNAAEINSGWAAASGTYYALTCAIGKLQRARERYCDDIPEPVSDRQRP